MTVTVTNQQQNAEGVIDAFFENGGDFGRPFLEVPLTQRISATYSEDGEHSDAYLDCFEHIDPTSKFSRPMLLIANDSLRSALKSKHRPTLEKRYADTGRVASELYIFGTAGVRPLSDLVGTRVVVAELAEFTDPEILLHQSVAAKNVPHWYARTNAVLHDSAHIFKEEVLTAAGASELRPTIELTGDETPHLPSDICELVGNGMPKNGYMPASEYFEKIGALHANQQLRLKAFRSNSQVHLASSFFTSYNRKN